MVNVNLMKGDCLELMKSIPDGSVDLILTDPPYGTTACKWDSVIDLDLMWAEVWRVLKKNGNVVLFSSQPFTTTLISSNIENFKYEIIWQKNIPTGFQLANKRPMKYHENICIFYKKQGVFNKQLEERDEGGKARLKTPVNQSNRKSEHHDSIVSGNVYYDSELKNPSSIQKFNRVTGLHPTQKPVALLEYLIKTYTNENETVLDFTMGSGSTGVACLNTNRNFIGIEMDENYFNIAESRINQALNEKEN